MNVNQPVVHVDKLYKTYDGVVAVDHLSFDINQGEIFGLLGPNGAGKTTTIRIVMNILQADSGDITIFGQRPGQARERVGYLPEERGLYRGQQVYETLVYLAQLKGMPASTAKKRANELLERVELTEWAKRKVQDLSRGMQQKLQLIASIIHDPELIILDEPFQGLDPVNVGMVRDLIRYLREQGKTIILSAHEMSQVEALCERIALINHGRLVLYGNLSEIKRRFAANGIDISPPVALDGWREVSRVDRFDDRQRVYLAEGFTPRDILIKMLNQGLNVERFELSSIPLEEIFIKVVTADSSTPAS